MTETGNVNIILADEAATERLGSSLARAVAAREEGIVLFLQGDLGAGKTTLSRGFMRGLGHEGAVKSPTYTLVEPYEHLVPPTWHFDLYRLGDPEELEYMGIRDYFAPGQVCLIEWAERGTGVLPPADLTIALAPRGEGRIADIRAGSSPGRQLLAALQPDQGV